MGTTVGYDCPSLDNLSGLWCASMAVTYPKISLVNPLYISEIAVILRLVSNCLGRYILSLSNSGGAHMEKYTKGNTTMNWDMIVSNVLSNAVIYLLGRLMDNWLNRRNK